MFRPFEIIVKAISGDFKGRPELQNGFWLYIVLQVFSIAALAYNATLSYSFYLNMIDQAPSAKTIAVVITTIAAAAAFIAINFVCFRIMFVAGGNTLSKVEKSSFGLAILIMIGLVLWDVSVNLKGTRPVSELTTVAIRENKADQVQDKYSAQISTIEKKIDQIYDKYKYKNGKVYFAPIPVTSISKEIFTSDQKRVKDLESQMATLINLQAQSVQVELKDYQKDQERFESEVQTKTINHSMVVKLIYGLVFGMSLFCANFNNQVNEELEIGHRKADRQNEKRTIDNSKPDKYKTGQKEEMPQQSGKTVYFDKGFSLDDNRTVTKEKLPEKEDISEYVSYSEKRTESKKADKPKKKKTGKVRNYAGRADSNETMSAILSAYKALKKEKGRAPTQKEVAIAANVTDRTVRRYMSQFKNIKGSIE